MHTSNEVMEVIGQLNDVLVIQTNAGITLNTNSNSNHQLKGTAYGNFNLGLHVHDDSAKVLKNRAKLLNLINEYIHCNRPSLAHEIESIYWVNQIHGNRVMNIIYSAKNHSSTGHKIKGTPTALQNQNLTVKPYVKGDYTNLENKKLIDVDNINAPSLMAPNADALVTSLPNTALSIMTADCVPIALYNSQNQKIAVIHAGWRGLSNGIIEKTFNKLKSHASDAIYAWIGTCIGPDSYEVSISLVAKLLEGCQQLGLNRELIESEVVKYIKDEGKAWLNLPVLAKLQLEKLNINVQLFDTNYFYACSYRNTQFYSYRRMFHQQLSNTGRMALLIIRTK